MAIEKSPGRDGVIEEHRSPYSGVQFIGNVLSKALPDGLGHDGHRGRTDHGVHLVLPQFPYGEVAVPSVVLQECAEQFLGQPRANEGMQGEGGPVSIPLAQGGQYRIPPGTDEAVGGQGRMVEGCVEDFLNRVGRLDLDGGEGGRPGRSGGGPDLIEGFACPPDSDRGRVRKGFVGKYRGNLDRLPFPRRKADQPLNVSPPGQGALGAEYSIGGQPEGPERLGKPQLEVHILHVGPAGGSAVAGQGEGVDDPQFAIQHPLGEPAAVAVQSVQQIHHDVGRITRRKGVAMVAPLLVHRQFGPNAVVGQRNGVVARLGHLAAVIEAGPIACIRIVLQSG